MFASVEAVAWLVTITDCGCDAAAAPHSHSVMVSGDASESPGAFVCSWPFRSPATVTEVR